MIKISTGHPNTITYTLLYKYWYTLFAVQIPDFRTEQNRKYYQIDLYTVHHQTDNNAIQYTSLETTQVKNKHTKRKNKK